MHGRVPLGAGLGNRALGDTVEISGQSKAGRGSLKLEESKLFSR